MSARSPRGRPGAGDIPKCSGGRSMPRSATDEKAEAARDSPDVQPLRALAWRSGHGSALAWAWRSSLRLAANLDVILSIYDFTGSAKGGTPSEPYGHGTHRTASARQRLMSSGRSWARPRVRVIRCGCRRAAPGYTSDVIEAINFALDIAARRQRRHQPALGHPSKESAATDPWSGGRGARPRRHVVVRRRDHGKDARRGIGYAASRTRQPPRR